MVIVSGFQGMSSRYIDPVTSRAALAATLATGSMYLLDIPWNPLTITMSSLTLGIGVTYGIHIFERYEHEVREHGQTSLGAAATAVAKLSRPIIGSSFTTIFGFGILMASRFPVLANFGKTTVLAIGFALLTVFVVFPAVLTVVPVIRHPPEARAGLDRETTDPADTSTGD